MGTPAANPAAVVGRVNSMRSNLSGINRRPIPSGTVTTHNNGSVTVSASGGREFNLRPNGSLASMNVHGATAAFHTNGRIASLHTSHVDVVRNPRGARLVVVHRPDHTTVVSTGPHSGYLERSMVFRGRPLVQRSYLVGGVRTTRIYTGYTFHGVALNSYQPRFFYAPAFYGWAYYPWSTPVPYAWGWANSPWYAASGSYFAVSPYYAAPYDWLTDFYLGQTLADAYAAGGAGAVGGDPSQAYEGDAAADNAYTDPGPAPDEVYASADTPITPQLKQAIAQEVQQQISFENAASTQQDQAPTLDDLPQVMQPDHVFVVAASLNVVTATNAGCSLSAGDVLRLSAPPAAGDAAADLYVASSHRADCPAGAHVLVSLVDLEEMQNAFRARLDDGLQALRTQQGHGGLPPAPPSAIAPPPRPTDYPAPDGTDVNVALAAANREGTEAEAQVTNLAFASTHP